MNSSERTEEIGQSLNMKMEAKKEEIIYRYFIVLIDSLRYKKTIINLKVLQY